MKRNSKLKDTLIIIAVSVVGLAVTLLVLNGIFSVLMDLTSYH